MKGDAKAVLAEYTRKYSWANRVEHSPQQSSAPPSDMAPLNVFDAPAFANPLTLVRRVVESSVDLIALALSMPLSCANVAVQAATKKNPSQANAVKQRVYCNTTNSKAKQMDDAEIEKLGTIAHEWYIDLKVER